jgi:hypothetical protein
MPCTDTNEVTEIVWWLSIGALGFKLRYDISVNTVEWARKRDIVVTLLVNSVTAIVICFLEARNGSSFPRQQFAGYTIVLHFLIDGTEMKGRKTW